MCVLIKDPTKVRPRASRYTEGIYLKGLDSTLRTTALDTERQILTIVFLVKQNFRQNNLINLNWRFSGKSKL